jgi:hypothetical protein
MALRTTGDQVELVAFDVGRISTSVPAQHTYAPADFPRALSDFAAGPVGG